MNLSHSRDVYRFADDASDLEAAIALAQPGKAERDYAWARLLLVRAGHRDVGSGSATPDLPACLTMRTATTAPGSDWPLVILRYLLGKITDGDVVRVANAHHCEACVSAGMKALLGKRADAASTC